MASLLWQTSMLMSGHDVSLENHTVANTVIGGMIYSDLLHHISYILPVIHWIHEFSNYLNVRVYNMSY